MYPEKIRNLREDKDLSQYQVACLIGTSQQQYSRYENGTEMPYSLLKKLAMFYNTSIDYILGLTNEKKPYPKK